MLMVYSRVTTSFVTDFFFPSFLVGAIATALNKPDPGTNYDLKSLSMQNTWFLTYSRAKTITFDRPQINNDNNCLKEPTPWSG